MKTTQNCAKTAKNHLLFNEKSLVSTFRIDLPSELVFISVSRTPGRNLDVICNE